jgi:hypothetical protein
MLHAASMTASRSLREPRLGTRVPPDHVRFCLTRPEKRGHCLELGLTHFVDDHPAVHDAIRGAVDQPVPGYGVHVSASADAERLIGDSLAG